MTAFYAAEIFSPDVDYSEVPGDIPNEHLEKLPRVEWLPSSMLRAGVAIAVTGVVSFLSSPLPAAATQTTAVITRPGPASGSSSPGTQRAPTQAHVNLAADEASDAEQMAVARGIANLLQFRLESDEPTDDDLISPDDLI